MKKKEYQKPQTAAIEIQLENSVATLVTVSGGPDFQQDAELDQEEQYD